MRRVDQSPVELRAEYCIPPSQNSAGAKFGSNRSTHVGEQEPYDVKVQQRIHQEFIRARDRVPRQQKGVIMWVGAIGFMVRTKDAVDAGTDHLVVVEIIRDGRVLWAGKFDYATENDLEAGAQRFYGYVVPGLYLDRTPPLPEGIGRIPAPYPALGMEYSAGLNGHMQCRLRIRGDDMWTKDQIDIWTKEIRQLATSFDTLEWIEDQNWARLGSWTQDVNLSTDSAEGVTTWQLNV